MGLFDKLLKDGADALKEVMSDENKEKATALFGALKDTLEDHAEDLKTIVGEMKAEAEKAREEEAVKEKLYEPLEDGKTCRQRILEILETEFPQYTVKEKVSPTTIGGTGKFMDYSIVVYDGETPKLMMMLIGKTTTAHREYRWSRQEAEKNGYAFINFVEHYPNTPEYISTRLHKYL